MISNTRRRWLALYVLCLGDLMIVLDVTIVNVALPSIRTDLGFTQASLAWVVNAYMLTFGGFLLLGGRAGDVFGPRRVFLAGIVLFTAASLACGLATTQGMLIAARAVQGIGGATVAAVALALIMCLFTEPGDRAKAMGVFGFVASGGGSARITARASSSAASGSGISFGVPLRGCVCVGPMRRGRGRRDSAGPSAMNWPRSAMPAPSITWWRCVLWCVSRPACCRM